jgi:hypothetical protein
VARHADNALGREGHGRGPQRIAGEMASLTGGIRVKPHHLMNNGHPVRGALSFPQDAVGFRVSHRPDAFEMARLARNGQVGASGRLFMVRQVTLSAVPGLLRIMGIGCRILMAGGTGQLSMRCALM